MKSSKFLLVYFLSMAVFLSFAIAAEPTDSWGGLNKNTIIGKLPVSKKTALAFLIIDESAVPEAIVASLILPHNALNSGGVFLFNLNDGRIRVEAMPHIDGAQATSIKINYSILGSVTGDIEFSLTNIDGGLGYPYAIQTNYARINNEKKIFKILGVSYRRAD